MLVLKKDPKAGSMVLKIEDIEDIWHLEHIVEPGDLVTSRTFRKTVLKSGQDLRQGDRKPMTLKIKAEKVEFQEGMLRITGKIIEGPEEAQKGSYHTLQIGEGNRLTVEKNWKRQHIERIENSRVKKPKLLVCILDREHCDIATVRESGIEIKAGIDNHDRENMEEYYKQIESCIEKQEFGKMIIAGPGFERENFLGYLRSKKSDLAKNSVIEHASSTGINGIQEVIKKSADRILRDSRISRETQIVQELIGRVSKEGLAVYGVKEVEKAVDLGAVETLMVSEKKVRDFEDLMDRAEKMRSAIVIIGSDHEAGGQFLHLGGIAGLLRFRMDY